MIKAFVRAVQSISALLVNNDNIIMNERRVDFYAACNSSFKTNKKLCSYRLHTVWQLGILL